jgi:D-amino-acid oxidase
VEAWAATTYETLAELAQSAPESGVVMREMLVLGHAPLADPGWPVLRGFRRAAAHELPPGYADGWLAMSPVVATPRYLPWLLTRLALAGGGVELVPGGVPSLAAAAQATGATLVVHCSGLGARALAGDRSLVPVRGQVAVVENPGLSRVVLVEDEAAAPIYVIPRGGDCVLGGTADVGEESLEADPATTAAILDRAARLVPELAGARLLDVRVGLRPTRPEVRLEWEPTTADEPDAVPVIHCYGHGGAGYTLAWGCAEEVTALVTSAATTAAW